MVIIFFLYIMYSPQYNLTLSKSTVHPYYSIQSCIYKRDADLPATAIADATSFATPIAKITLLAQVTTCHRWIYQNRIITRTYYRLR